MTFNACCRRILPLLLAGLLNACGGGASDSASTPAATPANSTTSDSAANPGAPVSVGNVAVDGRNWINYRRSQLGLSILSDNALVAQAAQSHSDYQRINDLISHDEDPAKSGFTGIGLDARLATAGFKLTRNNFAYGEVISATTNPSGFFMAEELVTAIYHRFVMFEPVFKEIGTGSGTTPRSYTYFTADFVANNGYGPGLGRGRLAVWPFNGQSGVRANFFSNQETPDPVDGVDEVGYPVSVQGDISATLAVSSFTIRPRNGSVLAVKLLQSATDPHTPSSAAAIIPLNKLDGATVYDVAFSGSADGVPVTLSWSFTTK
ncbi:CAP domain-containing protein [Massilia sp. PWRC2]|uniref:CAP domain-containing protein n=1 Tax=Massilia sp. PWRC2 TaxID=2804626 RepID=UPI003CEAB458